MNASDRLNTLIENLYPGPFNPDYIYTVVQYDFMEVRDTLIPRWMVFNWCEIQLRAEFAHTWRNRGVLLGIDWAPFLPTLDNGSN